MDGASADDIAACCLSQYSHLPAKSTKPGIRSDGKHEWTIVAGVVMEANGTCFCLSLCTGVKTLPYCAISPHGDLVHDSHAEVLARRGARTWLLKRLISEVKAQDGSESIDGMQRIFLLERDERWSIKADVKLHLYCSTFPCGDASSSLLLHHGHLDCQQQNFQWQETDGQVPLRGRTALSDSRLRLRTKPGKVHSLPTISMSCTDKIAMWSAVGMQGSLLSRWLEPVYFDSLVVGVEAMTNASTSIISKAVLECQNILQAKIGQDSITRSRLLKVVHTTMPFIHSKESVQANFLAINPQARIRRPKDDLDHAPAAGSIVWIRGERKEHLIQGRKQGVAMPKDKASALAPSLRSMLSKAGVFALFKEAEAALGCSIDESQGVITYFQAKHSQSNRGQHRYRQYKDRLRGSMESTEQQDMVASFLALRRSNDASTSSTPSPTQPPMYGWLVSGEPLESFV